MSGQVAEAPIKLEATYKAREVEGIVDLRFYRPIGFRLAQFFAGLRVTPAQVTWIGACLGIVAGHFYFYQSLALNLAGMILHVLSNLFDNVDGQLARLTNQKSRTGRALDGFADHLVFASVYLHLGLRYLVAGDSPVIVVLVLAAAASHGWQAALADYFRNTYLLFRSRSEAESSSALKDESEELSWKNEPWQKFLLGMYANFTRQQEWFSPKLFALRQTASSTAMIAFEQAAQPMIRWWGFALANTRMVCLFLSLIAGRPILYLWLEVTVFNLLVAVLLFRQERLAAKLVRSRAG